MKILRLSVLLIFVVAFTLATMSTNLAQSRSAGASVAVDGKTRQQRFQSNGVAVDEDAKDGQTNRATEAPTGFDNMTNGFDVQGPTFETLDEDSVVPLRSFNDNRFIFEEIEKNSDGLGPTYNA